MGVLGEASGVTLDRVLSPAAFAVPARLDGQAGLEHVPFLMWLADALRPGLAVHLAAGAPASCLALCEAVERGGLGTRVYAIGGSEWGTLEAERRRYASFATLIDGSPAGAASRFEDGSVDLLVADANVERGLEALLADWWPKLAGEGVLLVLGTSPPGSDGAAGGWRRLARGRPSFEFVHGGGAVLLVAGEPPEAISPLLSLDEPGQAVVRRVYERLGSALRDRAGLEAAGELADARTRELESELNWAHQAFAARGREASRLAARLVEIETSATWRATRPARAFLARHERLRRLVRPAAKLAWRALVGRRARVGPTALGFAPDAAYAEWIALYDEFGRGDRLSAEAYARRLSFRPLISVVMPVYDTPVDLLEAAIDSVRAQVYENWELCIADNGSRSADVRRLLAEAAES
ncbi:MAG: glycosyltransferase, partial [Mycolicibacterium hassiacum]|uniref:glycosyltransferase n=1 Tax=Mycolicibacterium hassiacum TaxID=46351 RepID=UPI0023F9CABA